MTPLPLQPPICQACRRAPAQTMALGKALCILCSNQPENTTPSNQLPWEVRRSQIDQLAFLYPSRISLGDDNAILKAECSADTTVLMESIRSQPDGTERLAVYLMLLEHHISHCRRVLESLHIQAQVEEMTRTRQIHRYDSTSTVEEKRKAPAERRHEANMAQLRKLLGDLAK